MKDSHEVLIRRPRPEVVALFDDPENLLKWQPDLIRFEPISGDPGQPGAKSRLVFQSGKGEFEMIETLTERNLPDEMSGTYETKMGLTAIRNRFIAEGPATRYVVDTEFKPAGMMKVLALLMRGAIRKQTLKVVEQFKAFAESAETERE